MYPHKITFDSLVNLLYKAILRIYDGVEIPQSVLDYYSRKLDKLDMFIE